MPNIIAENVSLHYPVMASVSANMAEQPSTGQVIRYKSSHYIEAIRGASFQIKAGERVGLVGRNGSGKSTLLRMIGGIYEPTAGRINVDGEVSSLFNINLGIQPEATGRHNILLRGLIKGMSRKEIRNKMDEIIEFSELGDFIDMPLRTYSQGMAMRLSFAIATTFSPEILLLDEWIGAGDMQFQWKAAVRMNELVAQAGITVIASHNRNLLRNICDTAIWLDGGVMRAHAPIEEVYELMDEHEPDQAVG